MGEGDLRVCRICGQEKSVNEFRKGERGKPGTVCKPCAAERLREWRRRNPEWRAKEAERRRADTDYQERRRKYNRDRYYGREEWTRDLRLRRAFGITLEQYRELEAKQGGVCAICGQKCKSGRDLAVDHDHRTDEIRGLLCMNCNRAIGWLQEDPELIEKAARYVRENRTAGPDGRIHYESSEDEPPF